MRRRMIVATMMAFLAAGFAFGQESDTKETKKKVDNTKREMSDVDKSIEKAKKTTVKTWREVKQETEERLRDIDKSIAEITTRVQSMDDKDRDMYVVRIKSLKEKSNALKAKLSEYIDDAKDSKKLEAFQRELKKDMKSLGDTLEKFF